MRKKLQGWNFNPNVSFGKTEGQTPPIFPMLPLDGQQLVPSPGDAPGLCQAMQSSTPKAQAAQLFPGVEEINTAGRNPFREGKSPQWHPDVQVKAHG